MTQPSREPWVLGASMLGSVASAPKRGGRALPQGGVCEARVSVEKQLEACYEGPWEQSRVLILVRVFRW